jgi:hypothetical protein
MTMTVGETLGLPATCGACPAAKSTKWKHGGRPLVLCSADSDRVRVGDAAPPGLQAKYPCPRRLGAEERPGALVVENSKAFRVGRRRFLTERAAFTHMARVRSAAMRECSCESAEYGDHGECYLPGYTCPIHDEQVRARYARLLRRAWKRGWRP